MKVGEIQLRLAATNRWWREPDTWQRDDPDLRRAAGAAFAYRAGALRGLQPGGLYVLRGPRRAGKSTEIKYAIGDLLKAGVPARNIVHAAVDGWRAADLRTLISSASRTFLAGVSGPRYWFLDEVTGINDDWPAIVKNLRDTDPAFSSDTVVLTGSSAAKLHETRKAFAGRRGQATEPDRTLLPMRFTDFVAAAGSALPEIVPIRARDLGAVDLNERLFELLPYLDDVVALWEGYLRIGGFPQAVAAWRKDGDVHPSLVEALWDVVYGDAIAADRFTAQQAGALLALLARGLCAPVNVSNVGRELGVAPDTAQARLRGLSDSFLAWSCYREHGMAPALAAQRKVYFTDPLLARLAALRGFGREPDLTMLSEQQLGLTLLRNLDPVAAGLNADDVLHYRSKTGAEIDFVGRRLTPVAIESKYVDDRRGRTLQTLRASPWAGIVASRSVVDLSQDIRVLPTSLLVLLLGG